MAASPDPSDAFREMLGHWEKMANSFGSDALRSEEFARAMNTATGAGMTMQQTMAQGMERALAASNLPSRTDIADLAQRLSAVEASLARIEAALGAKPATSRSRPTRGRRPEGSEG